MISGFVVGRPQQRQGPTQHTTSGKVMVALQTSSMYYSLIHWKAIEVLKEIIRPNALTLIAS